MKISLLLVVVLERINIYNSLGVGGHFIKLCGMPFRAQISE